MKLRAQHYTRLDRINLLKPLKFLLTLFDHLINTFCTTTYEVRISNLMILLKVLQQFLKQSLKKKKKNAKYAKLLVLKPYLYTAVFSHLKVNRSSV